MSESVNMTFLNKIVSGKAQIAIIRSISTDSYLCQEIKEISPQKTKISKSICGVNLVLGANSKIVFCMVFDNVIIGKEYLMLII